MISIDEQIADEIDAFELHRQIHCRVDPMMAAKIASLERLKRIDEVQVPEEPIKDEYECYDHYVDSLKDYIDTLLDRLKREIENREHLASMMFDDTRRAEAAEATIAAMLKLGEEPSEEMRKIAAGILNISTVKTCADGIALFRVLFAKLVEQAGVK